MILLRMAFRVYVKMFDILIPLKALIDGNEIGNDEMVLSTEIEQWFIDNVNMKIIL